MLLLHSISLFTVLFPCNSYSTRLKRCRCKIILILVCCLSHTYFFLSNLIHNQRYHMRSEISHGILLSTGTIIGNGTFFFQQITPNLHVTTVPPLSICFISCASTTCQGLAGLSNTACRIFSHTKTKRNPLSCPTDVCC